MGPGMFNGLGTLLVLGFAALVCLAVAIPAAAFAGVAYLLQLHGIDIIATWNAAAIGGGLSLLFWIRAIFTE